MYITLSKAMGISQEMGFKKTQKTNHEPKEKGGEMHFSRPHTSTAVMNIWRLWLPVLDLYTKGPVKSQSWMGEELIETYQLLLNLGLMGNSRRG